MKAQSRQAGLRAFATAGIEGVEVLSEQARTILYITRKWPPAVGGMETYSVRLTQALKQLVPVQVLALPGRTNGAPPTTAALTGFAVRTFVQLLFHNRLPLVVHLGDMVLWPLGLAARARSRKTYVVLSAHGTDVAYHRRASVKGRAYGAYLRLGARLLGSARVIANSRATQEVAAETGWRNAAVIPLATDLEGPDPTGEHGGHLLFAGRLVERKGLAWFVREVLPRLPDTIRLKVAGTAWDPAEVRALNDPRVDFVGRLYGLDLIQAYRQALCVVVPNIEPHSREYEGFGLVATEAAAAGGVVLAARTGGLVEAVDEGVTGMLVAPGDADAWAQAISRVVGWDAPRRKAFLVRSMARCREHYSWARVARETFDAYGLEPVSE